MDREKIAFVIYSLGSGGAERVVSTLANELSKKYQVTIITFIKVNPFYDLSSEIKLLHCADHVPPSKSVIQAVQTNFKLFKKISGYLKEEKIRLAIGFMTSANVLSVIASKFNNIPVIICERINPHVFKLPYFWELLRKLTYPKADYLVVQTDGIRKYFVSSIEPKRLKILPNPIAPSLTMARNSNLTREKIILNVGRLSEQKGQDQLIRAFAAIDHKDWELHIIGKGLNGPKYQKLISSLNLQAKVKILPTTKQIEVHYNTCSIFAFTSIFEGFPNALIEAMHYGLACVSTDCPTGPSELIKNGKNGFLIPMNDQLALQKHLQLLIDDEGLRNSLGKQALESVKRFEVKRIVQDWQELIEKGLDNNE